jgi:hypothetical protein
VRIRGAIVACGLAAAAAPARADTPPDAQLAWRAPAACPGADDARARIESRLGEPMSRFVVGIAVAIDAAPHGYVAHVGDRTLTSDTCDDLTDAVALVVARLATEAPRRDAPPAVPQWGGGMRGSWMSGIGGVPSIGIGGELAGYVRRDRWFGEVAVADWGQSTEQPHDDATAAVTVGLLTTSVRVGWAPEPKAIRAWLGADVGRMSGESAALAGASPNASAWVAVGPGFAVAWPIAPRVRLVGTLEAMAAVTHVRFVLQDGMQVYAPSALSARTTLGLEVGWR